MPVNILPTLFKPCVSRCKSPQQSWLPNQQDEISLILADSLNLSWFTKQKAALCKTSTDQGLSSYPSLIYKNIIVKRSFISRFPSRSHDILRNENKSYLYTTSLLASPKRKFLACSMTCEVPGKFEAFDISYTAWTRQKRPAGKICGPKSRVKTPPPRWGLFGAAAELRQIPKKTLDWKRLKNRW